MLKRSRSFALCDVSSELGPCCFVISEHGRQEPGQTRRESPRSEVPAAEAAQEAPGCDGAHGSPVTQCRRMLHPSQCNASLWFPCSGARRSFTSAGTRCVLGWLLPFQPWLLLGAGTEGCGCDAAAQPSSCYRSYRRRWPLLWVGCAGLAHPGWQAVLRAGSVSADSCIKLVRR